MSFDGTRGHRDKFLLLTAVIASLLSPSSHPYYDGRQHVTVSPRCRVVQSSTNGYLGRTKLLITELARALESITKPRLSTGSEFCIFNRFPRGNYLVWWVRVRVRVRVSLGVRVSVEVRIRVRVSNLLGSG